MQNRLSSFFFFALLLWMLYEGARLFEPFMGPILCAVAIGVVFYPMHERLGRRWPRWPASLRAVLSDLAVVIFLLVPLSLMIWAVTSEADSVAPLVKEWIGKGITWVRSNPTQSPWFRHLPAFVRVQADLSSAQVQDRLGELANHSLTIVAHAGRALAAHTFGFILSLIIFLLVLFFVFRDGEVMLARWMELMPLRPESRKAIKEKLRLTMVAVMRGTFLTSLIQGVTAAVGFLIVHAEGAFVLGMLTALATLIPSVGTALVWIPVSVYYFLAGSIWKGVFVVLWGILVVGVVDNLARPYIVGAKAEIPFLTLFFGLLGGLEIFGPLGILLGPLILGILPVLLEIYRRDYLHRPE